MRRRWRWLVGLVAVAVAIGLAVVLLAGALVVTVLEAPL